MTMRKFLTILAFQVAALSGSAGVAMGDEVDAPILAQLEAQGFTDIHVETSWLGRRVIEAWRADGRREIVINPRTGEILRDRWIGRAGQSVLLDPTGTSEAGKAEAGKAEAGKTSSTSASSGSGSSGSGSSGSGSASSGSDTSGSGKSGSESSGSGSSGSGSSGSGKSSGSDSKDNDGDDDSKDAED